MRTIRYFLCAIRYTLYAKRAFSLLELLVAVAIFFIIIGAVFSLLISGKRAFEVGNVQVEVEQEARRALDYMTKELRQSSANKIQAPADGTSSSTIIFEIPYDVDGDGDVINASGVIEWSDGAGGIGAITYSLSGGQILRDLSLGGQLVLANRITALTFSRLLGADIIEISLTAEKYALTGFTLPGSPKITISLNTQVKVRN